jgi:hypothetical protein
VYVFTISGGVSISDINLKSRAALGVSETSYFEINAVEYPELLFIEVPMLTL